MKKLLGSIFILLLPGHTLLAEKDYVSLTASNYPPYFSENMPQGGVITELISAAYKRSEVTFKVTWFPFARSLKLAKLSANYDGVYAIWHAQERAEWAYYSDPIFPNVLGFFKHKDMVLPTNWDMAYLKENVNRIGVVRGYINPSEVESTDIDTMVVNNDLHNLTVLLGKRVDLIVIDKIVAESLIKENFKDQKGSFVWLDPPLEYKMQYLGIAKNAPFAKEKITAFNRGLRQIKIDGTYQKIMKKHGFDWLLKDQKNWIQHEPKIK